VQFNMTKVKSPGEADVLPGRVFMWGDVRLKWRLCKSSFVCVLPCVIVHEN